MKINDTRCKSVKINGEYFVKYNKLFKTDQNKWKSKENIEKESLKIHENQWTSMKIKESMPKTQKVIKLIKK